MLICLLENRPLVAISRCVATRGVDLGFDATFKAECVRRFLCGDWGTIGNARDVIVSAEELKGGVMSTDQEDKLNQIALLGGEYDQIMGEYNCLSGGTLWLMYDTNEKVLTMMLPSEY